jgi:hypothetical protein
LVVFRELINLMELLNKCFIVAMKLFMHKSKLISTKTNSINLMIKI